MNWFSQLLTRHRHYDELSQTIREHIDEKIADLLDSGMTRENAECAARREFGNVTLIEQRSREVWQWPKLENTLADIRFAFRRFHKAPGFALAVILVLALGIAASVTIFAFVNAALLKPLPYQDPASLVAVFGRTATCPECGLSYPDYRDWSRNNSAFRAFDIWAAHAYVWRSPAGAQALRVGQVSGSFFQTLGVSPLLGRLFTPSDDTPAAPRTVVIPYGTWQQFFGGRADVIGESMTLNNDAYTVIGVLPREFEFAPRAAELWVTIHDSGPCEQDRACRPFSAVARLNEGVSVGTALANIRAVAAELEKQYPQSNRGQDAFVEPFRDSIIGDYRPILLILLTGAVLLLLIACLNVAGLFLVRSESRRREMAVRGALGASRARLAHQFLIEAALLVALSVAVALPASYIVVRLVAVQIPERVLRGMPYFQSISFDHRIFIFATVVSVLALTVCTIAPVTRLSVDDLHTGLTNGARSSSTVWRRFGSHLIVVELALAVVLLAAAGLLGKSFYRITHVELNFNPDHLATLEIDANTGYDSTARQLTLLRNLLATVNSVPGVKSAATATSLPVTCNCDTVPYRVQGHAWNGTQQLALSRTISTAYLTTLETRLLSGRSFNETDDGEHPHVALINRAMSEQFFPGEDPIGRIIGDNTLSPASLHQIIGVIDDIREGGLDDPLRPAVYFAANQDPSNYFFLVARTAQDPAAAMPTLAAAVRRLDPSLGVRNEFTMVGHLHYGAASYLHSSSAWFTAAFAACALLLGIIGLYGVIAYSVSQRTCEIGVRMALGAQRAAISRLIFREAAWLVLVGLALGVAASFFTGRLLRSLLFGVRSWDLSILIGVSATLAVATFSAVWVPARRAAATNPIQALRNE